MDQARTCCTRMFPLFPPFPSFFFVRRYSRASDLLSLRTRRAPHPVGLAFFLFSFSSPPPKGDVLLLGFDLIADRSAARNAFPLFFKFGAGTTLTRAGPGRRRATLPPPFSPLLSFFLFSASGSKAGRVVKRTTLPGPVPFFPFPSPPLLFPPPLPAATSRVPFRLGLLSVLKE